jgi:hypothetical protein
MASVAALAAGAAGGAADAVARTLSAKKTINGDDCPKKLAFIAQCRISTPSIV